MEVADYDVDAHEVSDEDLPLALAGALHAKGFCTVKTHLADDDLRRALKDVAASSSKRDNFYEVANDIRRGLLGPEASARIAEMDAILGDLDVPEVEPEGGLRKIDSMITDVATSLHPVLGWLGIWGVNSRTISLVHKAAALDRQSLAPLKLSDVQRWLFEFTRSKLMIVLFLGPSRGTMELQTYHDDSGAVSELTTEPGMMVILRPDLMSHNVRYSSKAAIALSSFLPMQDDVTDSGYAPMTPVASDLEAWVMQRLRQLKESESEDSKWDPDIPLAWQRAMNRLYHKGQMIAIRGCGCKAPASWDIDVLCKSFAAGSDYVTRVPRSRWDHREYYGGGGTGRRTRCMHGSFMDGVDLFDAKLFGISPAEAKVIDPSQRMVLETGYEALAQGGFRKNRLMNVVCGVYVGYGTLEWPFVPKDDQQPGAFGATGASASIIANRINFCLGLKGPSVTIDTEGSSSMTALCMAVEGVQKKGRSQADEFALAQGVHLMLSPLNWARESAAELLSPSGRCMAFDATADGWVRCDGSLAVLVRPLVDVDGEYVANGEGPSMGVVASTVMNFSGGSVRLHGIDPISEQEVVHSAIRNAHLSPLDIDAVECHGASTKAKLHDATEVASLVRAHKRQLADESESPLGLAAVKAFTGNMVEAGGLLGFLRALQSAQYCSRTPQLHLRQLNPLISLLDEASPSMATEVVAYRWPSSFIGTLSKGFGGTNVYAIVQGQREVEADNQEWHQRETSIFFWPEGEWNWSSSADGGAVPGPE